MTETKMINWDDAYTNGAYIADGASYPAKWLKLAEEFRQSAMNADRCQLDGPYGERPRNKLDLFLPQGRPKGLAIFVHGGYWLAFDKSSWSHLAQGALAKGYAVALPSYTLAPEVSVGGITGEVASAINKAAEMVPGPIVLAGHSAGGHLVSRMMCKDSQLHDAVKQRITRVTSISGVHDLRPLLNTAMGAKLFRSADEAWRESPALLEPTLSVPITCWVGADERPEFLRQNDLLANIWRSFGVETTAVVLPDKHHFDVIDDLMDENSGLTQAFVGA